MEKEELRDAEIEALYTCSEAFKKINQESRQRVLNYLISRYNLVREKEEVAKYDDSEQNNRGPLKEPSEQPGRKPQKSSDYNLIEGLDFNPYDNISLQEFFHKCPAKNNFEKNLIYVYYLEKILGLRDINVDMVYTCYQHTEQKVPGNLYQSLIDTRNRKEWLNTQSMQDIKTSQKGIDVIDEWLNI